MLALIICGAILVLCAGLILWHQEKVSEAQEPSVCGGAASDVNALVTPSCDKPRTSGSNHLHSFGSKASQNDWGTNQAPSLPPRVSHVRNDHMPKKGDSHTEFNALNSEIIYSAQDGNVEAAFASIQRMRASGKIPKLVSYGGFLNACAAGGQIKLAEQCWKYMEEDKIEISTICYSTMINVYASAGDVDKAEEFFKRLRGFAAEAPTTTAYNALIKACSRVKHIERAEAWFHHMKASDIEPNVVTFTTLINTCAKARDAFRAEKWLSEMSKHNVEANLMTYNTVIDACAKVGDLDRAILCFERMTKEGIRPDRVTFNSMINTCGKAGDGEKAIQWIEKMGQEGLKPCSVSFSTCLGICVKHGFMESANFWLTKMFEANVELSAMNYNTLIHMAIKVQDFAFAERLLHHLVSKNIRIEAITYRALIHALAKANNSEAAEEWLDQMANVHGSTLITADDMFGPVITAFCNSKNTTAIMHWLEKMNKWNVRITAGLYTKAVKTMQRVGNKKLAMELWEEMKTNNLIETWKQGEM
jgi:pentatricopeptide repeat protein